jgi:hypothetical protein
VREMGGDIDRTYWEVRILTLGFCFTQTRLGYAGWLAPTSNDIETLEIGDNHLSGYATNQDLRVIFAGTGIGQHTGFIGGISVSFLAD